VQNCHCQKIKFTVHLCTFIVPGKQANKQTHTPSPNQKPNQVETNPRNPVTFWEVGCIKEMLSHIYPDEHNKIKIIQMLFVQLSLFGL
jgi:hypothetical protein